MRIVPVRCPSPLTFAAGSPRPQQPPRLDMQRACVCGSHFCGLKSRDMVQHHVPAPPPPPPIRERNHATFFKRNHATAARHLCSHFPPPALSTRWPPCTLQFLRGGPAPRQAVGGRRRLPMPEKQVNALCHPRDEVISVKDRCQLHKEACKTMICNYWYSLRPIIFGY
jgi:hypothetical protein